MHLWVATTAMARVGRSLALPNWVTGEPSAKD
jgi:hypothetical protein